MGQIDAPRIEAAFGRAIERMLELRETLNALDAAMGDGDTGISVAKCAMGIKEFVGSNKPGENIGKYLIEMGMAVNRAASSSLGTLIATGLMRAGKAALESSTLDESIISKMLIAADVGIQERGKAQVGDKTLVDALHPAAEAFAAAIAQGDGLEAAGEKMLDAARRGRDSVIAIRSKIGRGAWVGERTENQPDPGTVFVVEVLEAILEAQHSEPGSTTAR